MQRTQIIEQRFSELLEQGNQIFTARRSPPPNVYGDDRVDLAASQGWATSAAQLLGSVFGRESEYYQNFQKGFKNAGYASDMARGLAVARAASNDFSKGYVTEIKTVVRAEVFDDFLEQAEHLFTQGYHQPSAVLAGAVLEDTLRKLCERSSIQLSAKPKLDSMNAELAKKGIYNTLVQKRLTWLADIRNKAAHGQWSEFSSTDVETMLQQVRQFVTDYLT